MYAYEWEQTLCNRYCRTPYYLGDYRNNGMHYQVQDQGPNESCEWIGDYSTDNGSFYDQVFRVEIIYDKASREIRAFHVTRERIEGASHYGSQYGERAISSDNKKSFYSVFRPIITKEKPHIDSREATFANSEDPASAVDYILQKWNGYDDVSVSDLQFICDFLLKEKGFEEGTLNTIFNGLRSREGNIVSWEKYAIVVARTFLKLPSWNKRVIEELHHILENEKEIINDENNHWDSEQEYYEAKKLVDSLEYHL